MSHTQSCVRCNTPFPVGAHYCCYCGAARDLPELRLTLAGTARRDHVSRPGAARRKPSLPLAVLAALFPRALDK